MAGTFALDSISGIDLNAMITSLVSIEQNKTAQVEKERAGYQLKIDAYSKLRSLLYDIKQKAAALSKTTSFDLFSSSSTNEDAVTIAGSSGSVDGKYDVNVFQLAAKEKMISADNRITSQSASLASQGITVGDISVNGVTISIDSNDTIQDLRSKINMATDAKGNRIGVTASVIKMADNNYRLVLVAKDTGSAGSSYKDVTGSTLQDLGIIATADGDKGSGSQVLQSTDDIVSAWNALGENQTITYAGTDHDGRSVSNTFVKTASSTIDDFLKQIASTFHNAVTVTTDGGGALTVTDKISGSSRLTMSELTVGTTDHAVNLTQAGFEGKGVLSTGKDAYFSIEGLYMESSVNSVSGFFAGTTFELKSVTDDKPVTVALDRDFDAITARFKEMLDAYNALSSYAKEATQFANPSVQNSADGDLAGDMTVTSIVNTVRDAFRKQYDILGDDLTSFTLVGVKSDSKTGALTLDEDKFKETLEKNMDAVQRLFVSMGVSDNSNVTLGRSTKDTQAGRYVVEEVDASHLRIRLENSTVWYTSDARIGDVINFSTGPVKGLGISAATGVISGPTSFNFSKGLSTVLDETIAKLTDAREGTVALRQTALEKSVARADERIESMNDRTERYRERLIRQFTDMETVLSDMRNQSQRLVNMFGTY